MIAALLVGLVSLSLSAFFARGRYWFDQEERKRVATLVVTWQVTQTATRTVSLTTMVYEN